MFDLTRLCPACREPNASTAHHGRPGRRRAAMSSDRHVGHHPLKAMLVGATAVTSTASRWPILGATRPATSPLTSLRSPNRPPQQAERATFNQCVGAKLAFCRRFVRHRSPHMPSDCWGFVGGSGHEQRLAAQTQTASGRSRQPSSGQPSIRRAAMNDVRASSLGVRASAHDALRRASCDTRPARMTSCRSERTYVRI